MIRSKLIHIWKRERVAITILGLVVYGCRRDVEIVGRVVVAQTDVSESVRNCADSARVERVVSNGVVIVHRVQFILAYKNAQFRFMLTKEVIKM